MDGPRRSDIANCRFYWAFLRRSTSAWLTSPDLTNAATQAWVRLSPCLCMQFRKPLLSIPHSLQNFL